MRFQLNLNGPCFRVLGSRVLVAPALAVPYGCAASVGAPPSGGTTHTARGAGDSSARGQFTAFLDAAVATRVPWVGIFDGVHLRDTGEGDEWTIWEDFERRVWIADSRVLAVQVVGDTMADASALLTIVADQHQDPDSAEARYIATVGVREDTAHWTMVRDPADSVVPGRWKVRGDAHEGFGVFAVGRFIRWTGKGSERRALALVDSIRKARSLPLVR